jgi:hypothetical protein
MELFCNLALHSYVATHEPDQLPVLETFPQVFAQMDPSRFAHRSLEDFERLYVGVGPENDGWYQVKLYVGAKRIYDSGGIDACLACGARSRSAPTCSAASLRPRSIRKPRDSCASGFARRRVRDMEHL